MFEWLKKKFHKDDIQKSYQKCLIVPMISSRDELVDRKKYHLLYCSENVVNEYDNKFIGIFDGIWLKDMDAFRATWSLDKYCKFEDAYIIDPKFDVTPNNIITYNPNEINALDLEEMRNICFTLTDDNSQSDDVWEMLIEYFDKRGMSI